MKYFIIIFNVFVGLSNCQFLADQNCGRDAELGELPYHASLQYYDTNEHFASAAVLNSRWILTTARGLIGRPADSVNIILGAIQHDKPTSIQRSTEFRIHPMYDAARMLNDIATVRGSIAINFPPFVNSIALSSLFIDFGIAAQVSGWNPFTTTYPSFLQISDVETIQCVDTDHMAFTVHHLCTRPTEQDKLLIMGCGKYPGSLLVVDQMLVGIKFHHSLGEYESMFGFLRISMYRAWIMANIPI